MTGAVSTDGNVEVAERDGNVGLLSEVSLIVLSAGRWFLVRIRSRDQLRADETQRA